MTVSIHPNRSIEQQNEDREVQKEWEDITCVGHYKNYVKNKNMWGMKMRFDVKTLLEKPLRDFISKAHEDPTFSRKMTKLIELENLKSTTQTMLSSLTHLQERNHWV